MKAALLRRLLGHEGYARRVGVKIGRDCRILSSNFGTEPFLIEIGDRVTVSNDVVFLSHDGSSWLVRDDKGRRYIYRRVKGGSECFIGARDPDAGHRDRRPGGRRRGCDSHQIGAGGGSIVAGVPARIIGRYNDFHRKTLAMPSDADLAHLDGFEARVRHALDETPRVLL